MITLHIDRGEAGKEGLFLEQVLPQVKVVAGVYAELRVRIDDFDEYGGFIEELRNFLFENFLFDQFIFLDEQISHLFQERELVVEVLHENPDLPLVVLNPDFQLHLQLFQNLLHVVVDQVLGCLRGQIIEVVGVQVGLHLRFVLQLVFDVQLLFKHQRLVVVEDIAERELLVILQEKMKVVNIFQKQYHDILDLVANDEHVVVLHAVGRVVEAFVQIVFLLHFAEVDVEHKTILPILKNAVVDALLQLGGCLHDLLESDLLQVVVLLFDQLHEGAHVVHVDACGYDHIVVHQWLVLRDARPHNLLPAH